MASSSVMPSSSSASSDLARPPSAYSPTISELQAGDPSSRGLGSMNMDEILRNIYGDGVEGGSAEMAQKGAVGEKTADEVWQEISASRKVEPGGGEMTLEDYLNKATGDDGRVPSGSDSVMDDRFGQQGQFLVDNSILGFGNGEEGEGAGGRGRGRKRAAMDPTDRAALQRQKRMIKNRESAARSRERKQLYTVELETLVHQLEEENTRLLKEEEDRRKQRLNQLMENLIPVTEGKKPPRILRRTQSM